MIFKKAFERLKKGLSRTSSAFTSRLRKLVSVFRKLDAEFLEQLEEAMLEADMGVEAVTAIIEKIEAAHSNGELKPSEDVIAFLKDDLRTRLTEKNNLLAVAPEGPTVVLVAGVNGTGKTTSIAKLAYHLHQEGKKVILAACDTFRAAAIEQLTTWSNRIGCDIVAHQPGSDPSAVAWDSVEAAIARKADYLLVDTAGRLQTKQNLMRELEKIRRVIAKKIPSAPHEVLLVLDATTGQNAISQAIHFNEAIQVTGLFLAKLDGTAKGGVIVAIKESLDIPVKFIGVGETYEDIEPFDADRFVEALLGDAATTEVRS